MLGAMSGLLAGLVGITPAAGFVNIGGALFIGFACAVLSYIAVVVVKKFSSGMMLLMCSVFTE